MRLIAATMILTSLVVGALAQGRWEKTISGCEVWNDNPFEHGTVTWSGRCKGGKADGYKGVLVWSYIEDGKLVKLRYEGSMDDGDLDGKGKLTWPNGDRYVGRFEDGLKNGKGVYHWANGNRYEGHFVNGFIQGKGEFTWASGDQYRGQFRAGLMHGYGRYTWASGRRYEGEFREGKPVDKPEEN